MISYKRSDFNLNILFVIIILLITVPISCDNFLTKVPNNKLTLPTFFKDVSEIDQAVIAAYVPLQNMYQNQWKFTELRSDNTIVEHTIKNRAQKFIWAMDSFTMTSNNTEILPYWRNIYSGIQRCNTVLNHLDDVTYSNKAKKEQFIGEAKFLRALYYFNLVRSFGKIPLVLKQTNTVEEAYTSAKVRTDIKKIYQQIIKDASDAVQLLPESYSSTNKGRATEGAARTLLAIVYLTQHKYSKTISELSKVTNLGYSLLPNYADIFNPNNKNNNEIIFSVQYTAESTNKGVGNTLVYNWSPVGSGSEITGDNAHRPVGLNMPTSDLYEAYEPNDKRREASIGYYIDPNNNKYGIARGDTVLYIKKLVHPTSSVYGVNNNNWPVFRYAQVLLMMAEAINEVKGPTGKAYSYINQVRHRAGLNSLSPDLSQSEFRKAVYHEERIELAFENHRWFNLLRTGRAIKVMRQHGKVVNKIQFYINEPVYEIKKYKLLYPIPVRALTLNNAWEQNNGWK